MHPASLTTRGRSLRWLPWVGVCLVLWAGMAVPARAMVSGLLTAPVLSPDQTRALMQAQHVLRDPHTELARRAQAARALLASGWPRALASLKVDLATAPDILTQRAITQALAADPDPPSDFVPILFDLLATTQDPLLSEVAAALGHYPQDQVVQHLAQVAQDGRRPAAQRQAAILALGSHRSQSAAGALVQLIEPQHAQPIREAAQQALTRLTGIHGLGQDPAAWQRWWSQHRFLSPAAWTQSLFANFDHSSSDLAQQVGQLQQRLVATQQQLYQTTPVAQRPALLLNLLSDPLDASRLLALDLTTQLLADVGPAGIGPDLRQELVARLDDPTPEVRRRAALLLRDLGGPSAAQAADKVAAILAAGREERPELLRAYLLVLRRMPRRAAVPAELGLLDDPPVRREAARALAEAVKAKLVDPAQQARARIWVRRFLSDDALPDPAMITLLGQLAQPSDWQRIALWLSNPQQDVKEAAAVAWADSDQPLLPLARHVTDPTILPILLAAAANRHDGDPKVLSILVDHKPADESLIERWHLALINLAGRVPASSVLTAVTALQAQGESGDLCIRLLGAALDSQLGARPADRNGPAACALLLARATIHRQNHDWRAELADCQQVAKGTFPGQPRQIRQAQLMSLEAQLNLNDLQDLPDLVHRLLPPDTHDRHPATVARTAGLLLDAAEGYLKAKQEPQARTVLQILRTAAGDQLDSALAQRQTRLERAAGIAPPATQPAPPATQPAPPATQPAPATAPTRPTAPAVTRPTTPATPPPPATRPATRP